MTRRTTSRIMSLSASLALVLATVVVGASPATAERDTASDTPSLASAGASLATETESGDVQDGEEPITFAELQERLTQLYLDRQISRYGWSQMRIDILIAERLYDDGEGCSVDLLRERFFEHMESFKTIASDPRHVPTESLRAELLAAADQLIALCGAPKARG